MTIQRYSISAFPKQYGMGMDTYDNKDAEGKYCLYDDVSEKIKIGEEAKQSIDKIQIMLELSQRREKILMELLDEVYKERIAPKNLERIVDVP
jgi:hypothetical protein